jgi:hypothetical protein
MNPVFATMLIATLLLAGCAGQACTMIGCGGGVSVQIEGMSLPENALVSLNDAVSDACTQRNDLLVFQDESGVTISMMTADLPDHATVKVWSRQDCSSDPVLVFEGSPQLQYQELRPNGPRCEPVCRTASAVMRQ